MLESNTNLINFFWVKFENIYKIIHNTASYFSFIDAAIAHIDACAHTLILLTLPVLDLAENSDNIYSQCFVIIACLAHPEFQTGREFSALPLCHG